MESVLAGHIVNHIKVDDRTAKFSKIALDQMLAL
jgi:quinolinate synthase